MKEIPTIARPAIIEELTNLTKKGVLTGQHWVDLTPTQRSKILRSHTNVTHKVTPANDGTGRTTDDGRGQSQTRGQRRRPGQETPLLKRRDNIITYSEYLRSLPVLDHQYARFPQCVCVTADIGCTYLNARMPKHDSEKLVCIKIDPDIATLLVEVDSNMQGWINHR